MQVELGFMVPASKAAAVIGAVYSIVSGDTGAVYGTDVTPPSKAKAKTDDGGDDAAAVEPKRKRGRPSKEEMARRAAAEEKDDSDSDDDESDDEEGDLGEDDDSEDTEDDDSDEDEEDEKPAKKKEATAPPATKKLTLENSVIPALNKYAGKHSKAEAVKVLKSFGVKKADQLPEAKWPALLKKLKI